MNRYYRMILSLIILAVSLNFVYAQEEKSEKKEKKDPHEFTMLYQVKTTPVKNQAKTGTCWSFATTAFVETELIRMGKGEHILSPIFNVRYSYPQKAENYVRYGGLANFSMGGQAHDVMDVIKKYGFIPEEVFNGMNIDEKEHNHGEMDNVLKAIVETVVKKRGGKITPRWPEVINATLNAYLGKVPKEFTYQDKTYTPKSFAESLGFNPDDYVELTSFNHHPFYKKFDLEVPDNWSKGKYYNLPIDELVSIMDNALENGYSVAWDGDVSEKNFKSKEGYAVVPVEEDDKADTKDKEKKENEDPKPEKEQTITQEMRQETFDNQTTTDDHLMLLTGLAKDQEGTKFYYTKNSWGTKDKKYDGYWYMSEPYVRYKTIAIMVHKNTIPQEIKDKLGIK